MAQVDALQPGTGAQPDEEFSERELEVLAMLPTPLKMRETSEELFVSRNTVKTHVRRVYRKLAASSCEEAVLNARDADCSERRTIESARRAELEPARLGWDRRDRGAESPR